MDTIFTYNTLLQYSALLNVHMGGRVRWGDGDLMYYIPECSVCSSTVHGLGGRQTPLLPWEPFTPVWHHMSISALYYRMKQSIQ